MSTRFSYTPPRHNWDESGGGTVRKKINFVFLTIFFIQSDSVFDADHEYRIAIEFWQKLKKLLTKQFSYTPPRHNWDESGGVQNFFTSLGYQNFRLQPLP